VKQAPTPRGATKPRRSPASRKPGPPQEVRIVGGTLKRSKLPVADKPGLRPTPDRVRETLYNWLGQQLPGWRVLDAFAGSGALGFEAASRGAAEVVLLERDAGLARSLRQSAGRLKALAVRVEAADALAWMARSEPARFDLVLLDPPFDSGLAGLALLAAARVAAPGGFVYVEAPQALADAPAGFELHRAGRAGSVHFHLLRRLPG
jgi:16S rRNA (guanine966-N2)-methyltransferase